MSWLNWLKGRSTNTTTTEKLLLAPGAYPLLPETLTVFVDDHELSLNLAPQVPKPEFSLPGNRCRSYLTRGLTQLGQREIMFVIAAHDASLALEHERAVLHVLRLLYDLAHDGRIVGSGDMSVFGQDAPFGLPHCGIAYLEPTDGPGPPIPKDALLAMVLRPEECAAANIHGVFAGVYRAAAWIALAYRLYPYPKFSDPSRPSAIPTGLPEESVLAKLPLVFSPRQASAFLQNKILTVELAGTVVGQVERAFAATEANPCFAIPTGHIAKADGRLVWIPKSPAGPGVIYRDGASLSIIEGGFVALLGQQMTDEAFVKEDGFSVMLRLDSWSALRKAIESSADIEIPMAGNEDRFVRQLRFTCA